MEQRPLRLGDLLDDYCPRERRITNHAIVAIVNDAIRQTRCTTCDAEHVYKNGQLPKRRKKDSTTELYNEVLANAGGQLVTPEVVPEVEAPVAASPAEAEAADPPDPAPMNGNGAIESDVPRQEEDNWAAHRPLIRATLPRNEGDQPPARPIPEFTMHQRQGRSGRAFRYGQGQGQGQGQGWFDRAGGNGFGRNGSRGNGRPGHDSGNAHGRSRRHGHGKKRSR